jgi:hypothetical protein
MIGFVGKEIVDVVKVIVKVGIRLNRGRGIGRCQTVFEFGNGGKICGETDRKRGIGGMLPKTGELETEGGAEGLMDERFGGW